MASGNNAVNGWGIGNEKKERVQIPLPWPSLRRPSKNFHAEPRRRGEVSLFKTAKRSLDLRWRGKHLGLGLSQPFQNGRQVRRIDCFRLAVALCQPQHGPRDFVLTFRGQARDSFQRFGEQLGHGGRIEYPRLLGKRAAMRKRIIYQRGEIGKVKVVQDFLQPPDKLVLREANVKVTLSLSQRSVDFFSREAAKQHGPYQRMILALVDAYAEREG